MQTLQTGEATPTWRTSSHCAARECVEIGTWRKSSRSGVNGDCVEVGSTEAVVGVRDSKDRGAGPVLIFSAGSWREFTGRLKLAH